MIEPDDLGPAPADARADQGWQPLPARARWLFMLSSAIGVAVPAAVALTAAGVWLDGDGAVPGAAAAWLVLVALGGWFGLRRYRWTRWRLDDDGFGLQRGRLWFTETRVPGSRVQHIDLRRGPLERRAGLSTLIVHTAGTRDSAVTVPCLDAGDAERLRDRLAARVEHDDDDA